jgi:hypothetical protein
MVELKPGVFVPKAIADLAAAGKKPGHMPHMVGAPPIFCDDDETEHCPSQQA